MKKLLTLVLVLVISLSLSHITAGSVSADPGWCWTPWDCGPSKPAAPAKPGAPAPAPARAVVPPTSAPEDFSLNVDSDECLSSGIKVHLSWTKSKNAEKYEIHRRKAGERADLKTPATLVFTQVDPSIRHYTDVANSVTGYKIDPKTEYEYLIKAVNSVGSKYSDFSAPQNFTTSDCNPSAVSAAAADAVRKDKEDRIKTACSFEGQLDSGCVQRVTSDCLESGRDETDQYLCIIASSKPAVPVATNLNWDRPLICDSNGAGIRLLWDPTGDRYQVFRKINNEPFKLLSSTRAAAYTDYNLPNNTLSASYYVASFSTSGLQKSSNQVIFPDRDAADAELRMFNNCKGGGGAGSKDVPTLSPGTSGTISYLELSIDREKFIGQEGEAKTTHTYAPGEPVRLGAQLFNSSLKPNNGCPVQGVTFKITKQNDDGSSEEIDNQLNKPVCQLHQYNMPSEPGNYTFKAEYDGEGTLLAAPPRELSFKVSKDKEVKTSMVAYINGGGGKSNPIIISMGSPDFATDFVTDPKTGAKRKSGTVDIGAKVFTASEDELCREAKVSLKFERIAECLDNDCTRIKNLTPAETYFAKENLNNCQSYRAPEDGGLTEPGIYKLTSRFIQGARGTALEEQPETVATLVLRKTTSKATITGDVGDDGTSKAKSQGQVAGIAVEKVNGKVTLINNPSVSNNLIPVRPCIRPDDNPNNTAEIAGVRVVADKLDSSGNNLGQAFNDTFPNDCQRKLIDVGDPEGVACYNFSFLNEDQDFEAEPLTKQVCFGEAPAKAQPFAYLSVDPDAGNISSLDDPIVTVTTNTATGHFVASNDGRPFAINRADNNPISDACTSGSADCVYQMHIYKPNGTFEIKFCYDNQNNCSEPLVFSSNESQIATDPNEITSVGMVVDGTEVELPFDGTRIGFNLAPTPNQPQYIRLAIHRADKLRDTFPTLTFIYDDTLGKMVEETPQPTPVNEGGGEQGSQGANGTGGNQICTPGSFKEPVDCTGSCASCEAGSGEARIFTCNARGTDFEEQGGECNAACAAYCPSAEPVSGGSCVDEYYPEPATIGTEDPETGRVSTGCTHHFSSEAYPSCSDIWDIFVPANEHAECQ